MTLRFTEKRKSTDWEAVASTSGVREVGVGERARRGPASGQLGAEEGDGVFKDHGARATHGHAARSMRADSNLEIGCGVRVRSCYVTDVTDVTDRHHKKGWQSSSRPNFRWRIAW